MTTDDVDATTDLLQQGRTAFLNGDNRRAHDILRKAAMLRPYDEKVWLALLRVVDKDEDRRVCLENVLSINPDNELAASQLDTLTPEPAPPPRTRFKTLVRVIWIIQFFMVGLLIGGLILALLHII